MRPGLLDINVLIALMDPEHEFHDAAHEWFSRNRRYGWATCPLTENACLRILGHKSYPFSGLTVATARQLLRELTALEGHRFWGDSISMLDKDLFALDEGVLSKHITDVYLLGLALNRGGRLVTFDRWIRHRVAIGTDEGDLVILSA